MYLSPTQPSRLDRLAYATATRNRKKLFSDGQGSPGVYARMVDVFQSEDPAPPIQVHWESDSTRAGVRVRVGWFKSPGARALPEESRKAWIQKVEPLGATPDTPVCIHLPATGDQGFQRRFWIMARPLALRGISSVLLEVPYYGRRRPAGQSGAFMRTLSDFWKMGAYTVIEGRALERWLREQSHQRIGVTGISMGGGFASFLGATIPRPLAIIPCIAGHTPAPVFTQALLSGSVDWKALSPGGRLQTATRNLRDKLSIADVTRYAPPAYPKAAIIVAGKGDAFVPPETSQELHRHWKGSTLRWLPGGHVSSLLFYSAHFREAVVDAFRALK